MDIRQRVHILENIIHSLNAFKECFLETHNFIAKIDSVIFTLDNILGCEKNLLDVIEGKSAEKENDRRKVEIKDGLVMRLL
jgi:hypothetical protein